MKTPTRSGPGKKNCVATALTNRHGATANRIGNGRIIMDFGIVCCLEMPRKTRKRLRISKQCSLD